MRTGLLLPLLLALTIVQVAAVSALPKEGQTLPNFLVPTHGDDSVGPQRLKGKYVVWMFAAEWCPHCRKELPRISAAWRDYGLEREDVVGVVMMVSSSKSRSLNFYKSLNPPSNWKLVLDADVVAQKLGITAVPTTLVVGPDGKVLKVVRGESDPAELLAPIPKGTSTQQGQNATATTELGEEQKEGLPLWLPIAALIVVAAVFILLTRRRSGSRVKKRKK